MDDPYLDKTTGLLKNKVNAKTQKQLDDIETKYTRFQLLHLAEKKQIYSNFDLNYSKALHKKIFQDVYPWAGEVRKVDIAKNDTYFAHHNYIESSFNKLSNELKRENYLQGSSPDKFAERAAYYMGEINMIHPFREGNGRMQRAFINDLARVNGYKIDFQFTEKDRHQMIEASIAAENMDYAPLTKIIRDNLVRLDRPLERIDPTQSLNKNQPTKQNEAVKSSKTPRKQQDKPDLER